MQIFTINNVKGPFYDKDSN